MTEETGTGFAVPEEAKPKKPRSPRKKAEAKAAAGLLEAINFVAPATDKDAKVLWQQHARIVNGWIVACNGSIAAGHPIEEDLTLCPHLDKLKVAVTKAGAALAMSALDGGRLSVNGAKFRAVVPCLPGEDLPPVMPDRNIHPINDKIKEGFKAVLPMAREEADAIHEMSLLLRANTVVGCNGQLAVEFWHGIDLPPGLAVPQPFAKHVAGIAKPLVGFGWTEGRSITFYFEGGGWVATQLMAGEWPDIDSVLNVPFNGQPAPKDLWEALDAIEKFSNDGAVHFFDDKLKSTYANSVDGGPVHGATYDVAGLRGTHHFSARLLKLAKAVAVSIDYETHDDRMVMYNNEAWLRGVLMKRIG